MMRTCTAAWRSWQSKEPAGGREGSGGRRRALPGTVARLGRLHGAGGCAPPQQRVSRSSPMFPW